MHNIFIFLNIVEPAEADIVENQQDLPTVSSEDMMKLGLIEDNIFILQVKALANKTIYIYLYSCVFMIRFGRDLNSIRDG